MPRGTVSVMTLVRRELKMVKREDPPVEGVIPSRVRSFIASDETVDSYNTIVIATGIDLTRFSRNSIVLLQHDSRGFPVGVGKARVENRQLIVDVEFAPPDDPISGAEAEQALRWIDRGVMGMSIGFDVVEREYVEARETGDPWRDLYFPPENYTRTELYEVSIVSVPANPNALAVGRSTAAQNRFLARVAPVVPVSVEPPPEQQSAALATFVERIVRESRAEQQSAELRRRGKTSRS